MITKLYNRTFLFFSYTIVVYKIFYKNEMYGRTRLKAKNNTKYRK